MKIFIWENALPGSREGVVVAVAEDLEDARREVDKVDNLATDWLGDPSKVIDCSHPEPYALVYWGVDWDG